MFKHRFRLPSPALAISLIALALALGGTAVAAGNSPHTDKKADTKLIEQLAPTLSVKHADSATTVGGQTVTRIFATIVPGESAKQVYKAQGLTLTFSCPTTANDEVVANGPAGGQANLVVQGNSQAGAFESRTEHINPTSNVEIGSGNYGTGVAEYGTSTGHVVSVTYGYDDASSGISNNCSMWGDAISR